MPSDEGASPVGSGASQNPTGRDANNNNNRNARRNNNRRFNSNRNRQQSERFEGREESLKGFIFDYIEDGSPDQFARSQKELVIHVGRTYTKNTSAFTEAVRTLSLTNPVKPVAPDPNDKVLWEEWRDDKKIFATREQEYIDFRAALYSLVLGQCTEAMEERLRSNTGFPAVHQDGIGLLNLVRTIMHSFEDRIHLSDALMGSKEKFYRMSQGPHETLQRYHERMSAEVRVLKEIGATIADKAEVEVVAKSNKRGSAPTDEDRREAEQRGVC